MFTSVLRTSAYNATTKKPHAKMWFYVLSKLSLLNGWFKGSQNFYMHSPSFDIELIASICPSILCLSPLSGKEKKAEQIQEGTLRTRPDHQLPSSPGSTPAPM